MKWKTFKDAFLSLVRNRVFYIGLFLIVIMVLLAARLYKLQIIEGEQYVEAANTINKVTVYTDAPRGNIYDRNGILLATNRLSFKVQMINVDRDQAFRDQMYLKLINLFEEEKLIYINSLEKYIAYPISWGNSLQGEENTQKRLEWINKIAFRKSDRDDIKTAQDAFDYLRYNIFKFDEEYSDEEAYKIMIIRYLTYSEGLSYMVPTTIAPDVPARIMEIIEARHLEFPGVYTEETYFRQYLHDQSMSHVIGYIRAISQEEYSLLKDQGYDMTCLIGKVGIEKAAESVLRGQRGTRTIYYDAQTSTVKELESTEPIAGQDVSLTIDYSLQKESYDILVKNIEGIIELKDDKKNFGDARAGSIVVSDVMTGEILVMVNYPTYDNKIFLAPSSDLEAQEGISNLYKDPSSPSLNRATQGLYPVGSTFKPLVALAALEEKVLTPYQKTVCRGSIDINNRVHRCNSYHGEIDMVRAIAESCNVYFYEAGMKVGIKNLDKWAKAFGLGEKTGIEISEYAGYRNNEETMKMKESDIYHIWAPSDTAQASIGQLYNLFTPLQLNNYIAAIANGGYLNTPHLIASIVNSQGQSQKTVIEREKIDISKSSLDTVKEGMVQMSLLSGIAKREYRSFPSGFVAGKTGTPETGLESLGKSSHSTYQCFAPADSPEIAVTVFIEHGASGGNSIPVAGALLRAYYGNVASDNKGLLSRNDGMVFATDFRNFNSFLKVMG